MWLILSSLLFLMIMFGLFFMRQHIMHMLIYVTVVFMVANVELLICLIYWDLMNMISMDIEFWKVYLLFMLTCEMMCGWLFLIIYYYFNGGIWVNFSNWFK